MKNIFKKVSLLAVSAMMGAGVIASYSLSKGNETVALKEYTSTTSFVNVSLASGGKIKDSDGNAEYVWTTDSSYIKGESDGIHTGSGSYTCSYQRAITSYFSDFLVKSVTVDARSNNSAKLTVKINNTSIGQSDAYGSSVSSKTLSNTDGISGGDLEISLDMSSGKKNIYLNKIVVVYSEKSSATLQSLVISTAPSKTTYFEGENFDPSGAVVNALYDSGDSVDVTTEVIWTPSGALTSDVNKVTASYSEGGIEVNADQNITVNTRTMTGIQLNGTPTKTSYFLGDQWDLTGLNIKVNYSGGNPLFIEFDDEDVVYGFSPMSANSLTLTSFTIVVLYEDFEESFTVSGITVIEKPLESFYDLSAIDGFSSWSSTYGAHDLTDEDFTDSPDFSAVLNFKMTNKQQTGVGSEYPCIGGKVEAENEVLKFTLNEDGYKISYVEIVFVTRYTSTFPSLFLHKGDGINSDPLDSIRMSGSVGNELILGVDNLNDVIFTVGYNAHQTSSNGAVGIKSILVGLEVAGSFGDLDHIKVTGLPNTVYHVGEKFNSSGLVVTAFDDSDEAVANFKDITSETTMSLEDNYEFVDSDVPGFDQEIEYEGKTTSFHLDVFALAEYKLVDSELTDWSGNYIIVGTNETSELCAMNGALLNPDVEKGYKVVSDNSGVISAGQELQWTISKTDGGYSIQGKSGNYIGSLTTSSNGMLVSGSPVLNTISFNSGDVTIAGTNGRSLYLNTSADRFRYYTDGSVKLYKLVESNKADEFAQLFLSALSCDATGENKPTFNDKEPGVEWTWALLAAEYDKLSAPEKEQFRLGSASSTGSNIQKALARYDIIVGKYFVTGLDETFTDFMNREPLELAGNILFKMNDSSNSISLVLIVGIISMLGLAGVVVIRKRRQN